MKFPRDWKELPFPLKERVIDNTDLDYDSYEGSFAEAKESLLNGNYYRNGGRCQAYYESINEETLEVFLKQEIDSLKRQLADLEKFV